MIDASKQSFGKPGCLQTLIFVLILTIVSGITFVRSIHDFLSPNAKIESAKILIVEGFTPDFALPGAIEEFRRGDYEVLACTGIPIMQGSFLTDYKSTAHITAASLRKLGFPSDSMIVVSTTNIKRDRTYACGLALADYLKKNLPEEKSVNLYSLDAHSRRSHLLFEHALGTDYKVGIIAAEDLRYDTNHWWKSSNGFRSVVSESIGWVYAKFFFHPEI